MDLGARLRSHSGSHLIPHSGVGFLGLGIWRFHLRDALTEEIEGLEKTSGIPAAEFSVHSDHPLECPCCFLAVSEGSKADPFP